MLNYFQLRARQGAALAASILCCSLLAAAAPTEVTVTLQSAKTGSEVSKDFAGLSYETQQVLPDADGKYYFSPDNKKLVALFKQLGIRNLRVGGNTADRPGIKVPGPADIDSLFAFARAADVKVIYTLRLREGSREKAAEIAKYVFDHYRPELDCFAIGNEPNVFAKQYPVYRDEWKQYEELITAPENAPGAMFCGPSATPGKTAWARDFVRDFGNSGHIAFISQHDYPGGAGNRATNVVAARDRMLSPGWLDHYQHFYDSFAPAAMSNGLPYRLEEANSFYNGGAKDVSDTFASALWALDYMHFWAEHQANGINFHTGDNVAAGGAMNTCRYASFWTSKAGYHVHPIGYGIKAFELGGYGRIVPLKLAGNDNLNFTAYAVRDDADNLLVTVINKEHGTNGRDASVNIVPGADWNGAQIIRLAASGDISVKEGVTLGGAEISDDASWHGHWAQFPGGSKGGTESLMVSVPAASAAVVKISAK